MLLVDTYNLHHAFHQQYGGRIDYQKLTEWLCEKFNDPFALRYAYVARNDKSDLFANFLRQLGYIVRTKEIRPNKHDNFDVELTVDALSMESRKVIICSSSLNLVSLLDTLTNDGTSVSIISCGVPHAMKPKAYVCEIPSDLGRAA